MSTNNLATRFGQVRGYFLDHGLSKHYIPIFTAIRPELAQHADTIRQWWNSHGRPKERHENIVVAMEEVVEHIKNSRTP
jgi:hypothetical protein